jgi:formamidopyrimidine-DNA glycosylase
VPELPEVETVVRDLRPHLTGRRLVGVRGGKKALRTPWRPAWGAKLVGRSVIAVRRRGKWIVVDLGPEGHVVVHLGMTGQLRVLDAAAPVEDHTHLFFRLDDGRELRFRDVRRFGSAAFFGARADLDAFFASARLGPEPFDLALRTWRAALARTRRSLKAVLLDQRVVAGVGNIYADESLHRARLRPDRPAAGLSRKSVRRLHESLRDSLEVAIRNRGSSVDTYRDAWGEIGGQQEELLVYGRAGQACFTCGRPLALVRIAGRSTVFCRRCQR